MATDASATRGVSVPEPDVRAIAFDVNGTLVEILTEDHMEAIFRAAGHFLTYQGIDVRRGELAERYFAVMKEQQRRSSETYPEFDAVGIWRTIIAEYATDYTRALAPDKLEQLPWFLAEMYRGISRRRLRLYPHVRDVLDILRHHYLLALVTDAQSAWAHGELHQVGLLGYFDPIVVSGDLGYRKPDRRMFERALAGMGVPAEQTLFVGNDMYRDVFGAREVGMRTVMFTSDQGIKTYEDCVPDHTISDYRELLAIVGLAHDPGALRLRG
jgi:putative hydrolase of the HAD superfamily